MKTRKFSNRDRTSGNLPRILQVLPCLLFLTCTIRLSAQPEFTITNDMGRNNISGGLFVKSALLGFLDFGKNRIETGFQCNLKENSSLMFSGFSISGSRSFMVKGIQSEVQAFSIWSGCNRLLCENNTGLLLKMRHNRFEMSAGTNFRTYTLRKCAVGDCEVEKSARKIHEKFNLMYSFSYFLMPEDKLWNVCLSLTNIDRFVINQETNPNLCLRGLYKPGSGISLFSEAWYKTAGALNLKMDCFGYFLRTGISWNFN